MIHVFNLEISVRVHLRGEFTFKGLSEDSDYYLLDVLTSGDFCNDNFWKEESHHPGMSNQSIKYVCHLRPSFEYPLSLTLMDHWIVYVRIVYTRIFFSFRLITIQKWDFSTMILKYFENISWHHHHNKLDLTLLYMHADVFLGWFKNISRWPHL